MIIVKIIVSIAITSLWIYLIGRAVHSHKELMKEYRCNKELMVILTLAGLLMASLLFIAILKF